MLADGRPLVLAVHEVVPVGLGLLPGDKFPERGDVEDHAVVEVGVEVQGRRPVELVLDFPSVGDERFLAIDVFVPLSKVSWWLPASSGACFSRQSFPSSSSRLDRTGHKWRNLSQTIQGQLVILIQLEPLTTIPDHHLAVPQSQFFEREFG